MRILLDPGPVAGGSGVAEAPPVAPPPSPAAATQGHLPGIDPVPAPAPAPAPTPAPDAKPAAAPKTIPVPEDMVRKFYEMERKLADQEAAAARLKEEKDRERLLAQAQKGEVEQAFTKFRETADSKYQNLHQKYAERERDLSLRDTLTELGAQFLSNVHAQHALDRLRQQVAAVEDAAGNLTVRDKASGMPVKDAVQAWLDGEGAIYLAPKGKAGAKAGGDRPAPDPRLPGDALARFAQAWQQSSQNGFGLFGVSGK